MPQPNCYPPPHHRTYLIGEMMLFCCPASKLHVDHSSPLLLRYSRDCDAVPPCKIHVNSKKRD